MPILAIFSEEHRRKTNEFRHAYTHRLPTQEILGHSTFVRRTKNTNNKGITYEFGHLPPMDINSMASELNEEYKLSLDAFKNFKLLVAEQIAAIKG